MPKVSVIIPTYNRAESLRVAISSVLNQTFQDFEIVVVDDASSDNTVETVGAIEDRRIKYLRHGANMGEAGSRNTGVTNATGEYVAFLDDDDEWLPEKLELQVDILDKSAPIVGATYTGFTRIERATGKMLSQWIATKSGDIFQDMLFKNWIGTPSTILLRRKCFETVGLFDHTIAFGLDYDMWVRVAAKYQFHCIQRPLVKYYIHPVRLSTNYNLMIAGLEAQLGKATSLFATNSKGYSHRYLSLGVFYCQTGDLRKGRKAFLKAIRLDPCEIRNYYNLFLSFLGTKTFRTLKALRDTTSLLLADVCRTTHKGA